MGAADGFITHYVVGGDVPTASLNLRLWCHRATRNMSMKASEDGSLRRRERERSHRSIECHTTSHSFQESQKGTFMSTPTFTGNLKDLSEGEFQAVLAPYLDEFLSNEPASSVATVNRTIALSDAYNLVHGNMNIAWQEGAPAASAGSSGLSDCLKGEITMGVDVFTLVFALAGIYGNASKGAAIEVLEGLSTEELDGLSKLFVAIDDAEGAQQTASAVFSLASGIYKVTGIRQILGAIEHHMAWYEWVIMGTVITAQLGAWFLSDGASLIADIALSGAFLAQLAVDTATTADACKWIKS